MGVGTGNSSGKEEEEWDRAESRALGKQPSSSSSILTSINQIAGSARVSPQSLWESSRGPLSGFGFVTPWLPVRSVSGGAGGAAGSVRRLVRRRSPRAPRSVP